MFEDSLEEDAGGSGSCRRTEFLVGETVRRKMWSEIRRRTISIGSWRSDVVDSVELVEFYNNI